MDGHEIRPIHVKLKNFGIAKYYTVWIPSNVSVETLTDVIKGTFPITHLREGNWYPQMIYRCTQLHQWGVTNGLGRDDSNIDISL